MELNYVQKKIYEALENTFTQYNMSELYKEILVDNLSAIIQQLLDEREREIVKYLYEKLDNNPNRYSHHKYAECTNHTMYILLEMCGTKKFGDILREFANEKLSNLSKQGK